MEWIDRVIERERLREETLRIPSWAKAEQLERIVAQKDLWKLERNVWPVSKKEETMEEKSRRIQKHSIAALAALLLFVVATFQIADGSMILGVVFFGAAACFSSLAGVYRERGE